MEERREGAGRRPRIRSEWAEALEGAFADPSMAALSTFLRDRIAAGVEIYPPTAQIFAALDAVAPEQVACVVIGQDPYPTRGNAHGYAFSVPMGTAVPASLANIQREIHSDLGIEPPGHGNLEGWAAQGVLLLNTILTVERGAPLSHKGRGWERFTDAVIAHVAASTRPTVFMLWGAQAQRKAAMIDEQRHLVIRTPHPSPLSAHTGWFGSRPFSRANAFLESKGRPAIDWGQDVGPERRNARNGRHRAVKKREHREEEAADDGWQADRHVAHRRDVRGSGDAGSLGRADAGHRRHRHYRRRRRQGEAHDDGRSAQGLRHRPAAR